MEFTGKGGDAKKGNKKKRGVLCRPLSGGVKGGKRWVYVNQGRTEKGEIRGN